jgi:hypothetical protein
MDEATKRCRGCGETRAHSEFHKDRRKPDGLRSRCKPCVNAYQLARQRAHKAETGQYASRGYLYTHTCVVCDKIWQSNSSRVRWYCSAGCANSVRSYKRTCEACSMTWQAKSSAARWCSIACRQGAKSPSADVVLWRPLPWWTRRVWFLPVPPRRWYAGQCRRCSTWFVIDQPANVYCSQRCGKADSKDRRRARKKHAYVERVYRRRVFERDRWTCQLCRRRVKQDAVVPHPQAPVLDHVIPLADGGTHEPANVQCAHFICNSVKGARGGGEQLALIG